MEGDAGSNQLNPTGADDPSQAVGDTPTSEELATEAKAEQAAPEANAEQAAPEANAEETAPEAKAEESTPSAEDTTSEAAAEGPTDSAGEAAVDSSHHPSRVDRGWLVGICATLLLLSLAVATGGYFALRSHAESEDLARAESAAVQAAKDCVAATQAPDTAAMAASQQKFVECSTGDYGVEATFYSSVFLDAYQVANAQVKVSDMRAAVERHNDDGSVDVLVALRVQVTNSATANNEVGYRLRVTMAPVDGQYKIAELKQVSS